MLLKKCLFPLIVMGLVIAGCGPGLDEDGAAETTKPTVEVGRSALLSDRFVPAGSNLNFIGLYRLQNRLKNYCLQHDMTFAPCTTAVNETKDQFAIYQGADNNYQACLPQPPTFVPYSHCIDWEYSDGTPDWFFNYPSWELQGGNVMAVAGPDGSYTCANPDYYSNPAYVATCIQTDYTSVESAKQTPTMTPIPLSSQIPGTTGFTREHGDIYATATAANEFTMEREPGRWSERPMLRHDVNGDVMTFGAKKAAEPNRTWSPLRVPDDIPAAQKKQFKTSTAVVRTVPTCTIEAKSQIGGAVVSWTSAQKPLTCLLTIDGVRQGKLADCNNTGKILTGKAAGVHNAKLYVGGPFGTGSCTAWFTVPSPRISSFSVAPESPGTKTTCLSQSGQRRTPRHAR